MVTTSQLNDSLPGLRAFIHSIMAIYWFLKDVVFEDRPVFTKMLNYFFVISLGSIVKIYTFRILCKTSYIMSKHV